MSEHEDSMPPVGVPRTLQAIADKVAGDFIHRLAPAFRPPARLVCPSDEAEQVVVDAVTRAAVARGIPVEVIDVRSAPAERLDAVTARLKTSRRETAYDGFVPTLLILRGFDVFGDDTHDEPTYPFRSEFQFDERFLWLFVGRDASRMRFLFGSYQHPLYHAAGDITPEDWQPSSRPSHQQK
jgi:hypothetical protein